MKFCVTLALIGLLSGCAIIAVADLAVTTVATVAKAGVQTAGAAVSAMTSEKKPDKPKSK